jgi:hypothetical protein
MDMQWSNCVHAGDQFARTRDRLGRRTRTTLSELGQAVRPHLAQLMTCADDARRAASSLEAPQIELQESPTDWSPERMEVVMPKSLHFIAAIGLVALAVIVVIKTPISTPAGPAAQPLTISVDDLHRSITLSALPVQDVRDLF